MSLETKRVLTVNLHRKLYPADRVMNNINYMGGNIELTSQDIDTILENIPTFWNTEKDYLIKFVYFEDGTYMCQREKDVYNFSRKENEKKLYFFDVATIEQVNSLVKYFAEYYGKIKVTKISDIYDTILSKISDYSYIKFNLLEARKKLLQESDYKMMPDYPLSDEEKQNWSEYRQKLRDITEQNAWKENNFINVEMPPSPEPKEQLVELLSNLSNLVGRVPPKILDKFKDSLQNIGIENVIKKYSETTLKIEIIKGISSLGLPLAMTGGETTLPILTFAVNRPCVLFKKSVDLIRQQEMLAESIGEEEISGFSASVLSKWQQYLSDIDSSIDQINSHLQNYNIDFTIGDIIEEVSALSKKKLDDIENIEKVEDLLQDLHIETTYGEHKNLIDAMVKSAELELENTDGVE
jgi:hypothetical protein